ncbi:hypothetical protein [Mycobacterium sp. NPDC004974]
METIEKMSISNEEIYDAAGRAQYALSQIKFGELSPTEVIAYASAQATTALALATMQGVEVQRAIYGALGDLSSLSAGQRAQLVRIAAVMESAR